MIMAGYSPSVRLFEAAACGAAIISDNWPGFDHFFAAGDEILLPTGSDDVIRYLTELSDTEVRRIGVAAQERVLAEHTSAHRALELERELEKCFSASQLASAAPYAEQDADNDKVSDTSEL
jgi:spore maturation protein CgeB